jgi:hypothetical protein
LPVFLLGETSRRIPSPGCVDHIGPADSVHGRPFRLRDNRIAAERHLETGRFLSPVNSGQIDGAVPVVMPEKGLVPSIASTGVADFVIGPVTGVAERVRRAFEASFRQVAEQYRCSW